MRAAFSFSALQHAQEGAIYPSVHSSMGFSVRRAALAAAVTFLALAGADAKQKQGLELIVRPLIFLSLSLARLPVASSREGKEGGK